MWVRARVRVRVRAGVKQKTRQGEGEGEGEGSGEGATCRVFSSTFFIEVCHWLISVSSVSRSARSLTTSASSVSALPPSEGAAGGAAPAAGAASSVGAASATGAAGSAAAADGAPSAAKGAPSFTSAPVAAPSPAAFSPSGSSGIGGLLCSQPACPRRRRGTRADAHGSAGRKPADTLFYVSMHRCRQTSAQTMAQARIAIRRLRRARFRAVRRRLGGTSASRHVCVQRCHRHCLRRRLGRCMVVR